MSKKIQPRVFLIVSGFIIILSTGTPTTKDGEAGADAKDSFFPPLFDHLFPDPRLFLDSWSMKSPFLSTSSDKPLSCSATSTDCDIYNANNEEDRTKISSPQMIPTMVQVSAERDVVSNWMGVDDLEDILSSRIYRERDVELVRLDGNGNVEVKYGVANFSPKEILASEGLDKGYTLVLNDLHLRSKKIADVIRSLEAELPTPQHVGCNAYVTPANATAFDPHFDATDIIVMQIVGYKRWSVAVTSSLHWDPAWRERPASLVTDERHEEIILRPGDSIFIPKGYRHNATTASLDGIKQYDGPSIHWTLGIEGPKKDIEPKARWKRLATSSRGYVAKM